MIVSENTNNNKHTKTGLPGFPQHKPPPSVSLLNLEPFLKRLGHGVKRVILGSYWDAERAAKVKVKPNTPTIILFLAPKIVGTMTNPQKVETGVVEEIRARFPGWQVAIDRWHRKQPQEICDLLTRDVPLTPRSLVALDPHRSDLDDFMARNTLFTAVMPLMNETGEVLESILLITEHVGISLLGEPTPNFQFPHKIYEGKTRFSSSDDEDSAGEQQELHQMPTLIRQGAGISLSNQNPQKSFFTLGFVGNLPEFDGPVCITAGHPFLIKPTQEDRVLPVFNRVDEDRFESAPPRQLGKYPTLRQLTDIRVEHQTAFDVTADVAFFPLETNNFAPSFPIEDGRPDSISSWHTWESLFETFGSIKSISKRGAATNWSAKTHKEAPKAVSQWHRGDRKFFMSGPATRDDEDSEEDEEEHQSRRLDDPIQKKSWNQLAFSFVKKDRLLAAHGDSGSSYRDQDNKLLGFQSCIIDGGYDGVSLATVVPAPIVKALMNTQRN